jgi:hypothetical protein
MTQTSQITSRRRTALPDVFISYSTKDKHFALDVARSLESAGWTVWMDRWSLLGGKRFEPTIRKALNDARCVVVLWSTSASTSRWVAGEADIGAEREVLVPVRLDDTELPVPLRPIHAVDLSSWKSMDLRAEPFTELLRAIAAVLQQDVPEADPRKLRPHSRRQISELVRVLGVAALLIALVTWVGISLDLPRYLSFGVPVALTVVAWFVEPIRRLGALHWLRDLSVSWPAIAGEVATLGLCSVGASITVERDDSELPPSEVRVADAAGALLRIPGTISRAEPRWHKLVLAPPWGRDVVVSVDGYDTAPVRVGAFRDRQVQVPSDLMPRPVLVLRLFRNDVPSANGALVRIARGGRPVAEHRLGNGVGALVIGATSLPHGRLQQLADGWRAALMQDSSVPAPAIPRVVAQWQTVEYLAWNDPPALDARLDVTVEWASRTTTTYKSIVLGGAFNDVETHPR